MRVQLTAVICPSTVTQQSILTSDRIVGLNARASPLHQQNVQNFLDEAVLKDDSKSIVGWFVLNATLSPFDGVIVTIRLVHD